MRRAPLLDPARRRERVEVAHVLGYASRVAGGLDPDVRPPGQVRSRRAEHVADDLAAARGDGSGGVLRGELLDRPARHVELLVRGRQRRLVDAVGGMPLREQARCVVEELGAVGMDLEAHIGRHRTARCLIREDDPA